MVACGMAENIVLTNKYKIMNREIKFRAWQDDQMLQQPMSGNYALTRFIGFLYEDAPIMQFTGLKDKNGKEIYEGDFVKFFKDTERIEVIEFRAFCFTVGKNLNFRLQELYDYYGTMEVVGNIYENPNLL